MLMVAGVAPAVSPVGTGAAVAAQGAAIPFDFDGDGYADLAVGVSSEDLRGKGNVGAVQVLYGSVSGVTARDQLWHQGRRGVKGALERGDRFGEALASGDFDADGYADLAIGIPRENIGRKKDAGVVQVLYGSPSGLTARDQIWHQGKRGVPGANEAGDLFGLDLAVGDFDADGFADLAVGIPWEDIGSIENAGAVTVLLGSRSGLTSAGSVTLRQGRNGLPSTPGTHEGFGMHLAAGNINGDAQDDLVVAGRWDADFLVPGHTDLQQASSPVHVIFGSTAGLTPSGSQYFSPETLGFNGEHEYTYMRWPTVADLNGDGLDDLAGWFDMWRPSVHLGSQLVVLHGHPDGLHLAPLQSANTPGSDGILATPEGYGWGLVTTDFNGDGPVDLVASSDPWRDRATIAAILGTGSGLGTSFVESPLGLVRPFSIGALPLSGGSREWLVVGGGGGPNGGGAVGVLQGTAAGTAGPVTLWHQDSPGIKGRAEAGDLFGSVLG